MCRAYKIKLMKAKITVVDMNCFLSVSNSTKNLIYLGLIKPFNLRNSLNKRIECIMSWKTFLLATSRRILRTDVKRIDICLTVLKNMLRPTDFCFNIKNISSLPVISEIFRSEVKKNIPSYNNLHHSVVISLSI